MRSSILYVLLIASLAATSGCKLLLPEVAQQPVIRNPFPQLRRVAVAPFFNQSDEPTLDGRQVAGAYYAELQATPGFEVVPLGVVEEAIIANQVDLSGPGEARRLAQILGVDAVVVGSVTDFSEYYPPRVGLRVEWYAANPGFHEIPAGYGLPWDTPEEEFIPDSLVYESQMALARTQMASLSPDCDNCCQTLPAPPGAMPTEPAQDESLRAAPQGQFPSEEHSPPEAPSEEAPSGEQPSPELPAPAARTASGERVRLAAAEEELPPGAAEDGASAATRADVTIGAGDASSAGAMGDVPMPSCDPACNATTAPAARPPCRPFNGPVLSHTNIYRGNDGAVAEALQGYVSFRQDDRWGGWKSYLRRSDDYIRFCCHMHISEMLSARGGSRKTQVVWRWPERR